MQVFENTRWKRMGSGDPPGLQNRRAAGHPVAGAFDSHTLPPSLSRPSIDNTGKFEMVCLPGDSGGKGGLREGKQPRPDKLNLQVWIRRRIDHPEPVSVMHWAAQAEGFDVPIGTFKNYVTEMRKQIRTAALFAEEWERTDDSSRC